jgi:hypothetical protein
MTKAKAKQKLNISAYIQALGVLVEYLHRQKLSKKKPAKKKVNACEDWIKSKN